MCTYVTSQSETTEENESLQDSVPYQVFINVLQTIRHDQVCCQPPTFTPSLCYDNQRTSDLIRRAETNEEVALLQVNNCQMLRPDLKTRGTGSLAGEGVENLA